MMNVSSYGFKIVARSPKTENMTLNWHDEKSICDFFARFGFGNSCYIYETSANRGRFNVYKNESTFLVVEWEEFDYKMQAHCVLRSRPHCMSFALKAVISMDGFDREKLSVAFTKVLRDSEDDIKAFDKYASHGTKVGDLQFEPVGDGFVSVNADIPNVHIEFNIVDVSIGTINKVLFRSPIDRNRMSMQEILFRGFHPKFIAEGMKLILKDKDRPAEVTNAMKRHIEVLER
jgi:hypothetical protein